MKRAAILGMLLTIFAMTSAADAGLFSRRSNVRYVQRQDGSYVVQRTRPRRRPGLFRRMIELERRKNAWLRRTFFGR